MPLCPRCLLLGYCRKLNTRLISDEELADPEFIRDVRAFTESLGKTRDEWKDYLADLYRDYRGRILDVQGEEIFLDMELLEQASTYWFRDTCQASLPHVRPRLRIEARERFRVLATILRASFPDAAQFWGVRPANDNDPKKKRKKK